MLKTIIAFVGVLKALPLAAADSPIVCIGTSSIYCEIFGADKNHIRAGQSVEITTGSKAWLSDSSKFTIDANLIRKDACFSDASFSVSSPYLSTSHKISLDVDDLTHSFTTDIPILHGSPISLTITASGCDLTGYVSVTPSSEIQQSLPVSSTPTEIVTKIDHPISVNDGASPVYYLGYYGAGCKGGSSASSATNGECFAFTVLETETLGAKITCDSTDEDSLWTVEYFMSPSCQGAAMSKEPGSGMCDCVSSPGTHEISGYVNCAGKKFTCEDNKSELGVGAIVGIALALLLAVAVGLAVLYHFCQPREGRKHSEVSYDEGSEGLMKNVSAEAFGADGRF